MAPIKQICSVTGLEFEVNDTEQLVMRRVAESNAFLKEETLPLPDVHPFEDMRQFYVFGNLRKLYRAKSCISGSPQLSRYDPAFGYKICTYDEYFTDAVDNTEAGMALDFSRPFFEQWAALWHKVILPPLNRKNCENSEYVNGAVDLLRCYLCFATMSCQDCMYCLSVIKSNDCLDLTYSKECQLCYSSHGLVRCYEVQESADCYDSQNLFACYDCRSCKNCFGCVGLFHAEFHIFNQKVKPEEYRQFVSDQNLASFQNRSLAKEKCAQFISSTNHRANTLIDCSSCSGAYLYKCEELVSCYSGMSSTNCGYCLLPERSHYCYRGLGVGSEFNYRAHGFDSARNAYSYTLFGGEGNFYSAFMLQNCSHTFGCLALRAKSYCILNQQYTREEYADLLPRVVALMKKHGEWGKWFPIKYAPHAYEEASCHEFLAPIDLALARKRGYRMAENVAAPNTAGALRAEDLPDVLGADAMPGLLSKSVICSATGQIYNFQRRELEYYLRYSLPLPRLHWNERFQRFINQRELVPAV